MPADTLTPNLELTNQTEGGNSNSWGVIADANFEEIDDKLGDTTDITTTGGDTTLTKSQEIVQSLQIGGTLVSNATIIFSGRGGMWVVENLTTGNFTVTCKVSGQTGTVIAQGTANIVFCDGTDIRRGTPTGDLIADTSPQLGGDLDANGFSIQFDDATGIEDDSGNEQLIFQKTASAVNHLEATNAAVGNPPQLGAAGDDTDISLKLAPKGTGAIISPAPIVAGHTAAIAAAGALTAKLQAVAAGAEAASLAARFTADSNPARAILSKSRHGTIGSHTVVQSGDVLGEVRFEGSDGAGFLEAAAIRGVSDGTPGSNDMPGGLVFLTVPDGSTSETERLAIRASGKIQIPNRSAPLITFDGSGYADIAEISDPGAPAGNTARLFALDVGGVTHLAYLDSADTLRVFTDAPARAYDEYTTNENISTTIPHDDTIPQNTEGTEILSASITLKRADSRVRATFIGQPVGASGNPQYAAAALFKDSDADALRAVYSLVRILSSDAFPLPNVQTLVFEHAPGSVGPFTYAIRVGSSNGSAIRFNGQTSGRLFGGVSAAVLILEEVFIPS